MTNEEALEVIKRSCIYDDEERDKHIIWQNDNWGWAVSFAEEVPEDKLVELAHLIGQYGECGALYWVSERNGQMKSEFHDINRFVEFVRNEERIKKEEPDYNKRAYTKAQYTIGKRP